MSQQASMLSKSAGTSTAGPTPNPAPIVELARFLARGLRASSSLLSTLLSRTTATLALSLLAPLALLARPLAYLLAPVLLLARVLLDVCVRGPYAFAAALARDVHPLYAFVGAACICAAAVGFAARVVAAALAHALVAPRPSRARRTEPEFPDELPASPVVSGEPRSEKSAIRTSSGKPRVKKRVSIKEERET